MRTKNRTTIEISGTNTKEFIGVRSANKNVIDNIDDNIDFYIARGFSIVTEETEDGRVVYYAVLEETNDE